MAAEPNTPKTGIIAYVTALSLILVLVSVAVIEGLFYIWNDRAQEKAGAGNLPSQLEVYNKEQVARLTDIDKYKAAVIEEAKAGKSLAAPSPSAPSKDKAPTDRQGDAPSAPPGKNQATPGKTAPEKNGPPSKGGAPTKAPEKQ